MFRNPSLHLLPCWTSPSQARPPAPAAPVHIYFTFHLSPTLLISNIPWLAVMYLFDCFLGGLFCSSFSMNGMGATETEAVDDENGRREKKEKEKGKREKENRVMFDV
ncbi:hypothetical protein BO78DRAFT_138848 [Aspergillus sclerotiicarbonarius CBS 121057]|uniref:Uncharacterized protein n=1 Tax=Aspergillus sclerotiicarbonarius (strain CBS 121057 / IBT 28362) TaxID=1448318 RepID=A0A319EQK5_ASPSB|nr:hypothetical protein BO78DRAFT_138848 [Aspergillus sclerotiicarbonarius CBS 121057]